MSADEKFPADIEAAAKRMLDHVTFMLLPVLPDRLVRGSCNHAHSAIDHYARRVWCRRCGAPLDAFDVLSKLSREFGEYKDLIERRNRLRHEIEVLEEQHRRVKANKRAAERTLMCRPGWGGNDARCASHDGAPLHNGKCSKAKRS